MSEPPTIEEIRYGSSDYRMALDARDRILRQPLGLVLTPGDTAGEECQRHFVLRSGKDAIAGVIAIMADHGHARLRQMWVEGSQQGRGLGRQLLQEVEKVLFADGMTAVELHARLHVRAFYEACGYTAEGEVFEEIGIPHIRMVRSLSGGSS